MAHLTFQDGKIVEQRDESTISQFAFARMAFGFPKCLTALTPLFGRALRKKSLEGLREFQQELTRFTRAKTPL